VAGDTVCRFLQVPSYPLTADTRKITSDSLPASVANYRALVDRLRGTPFEVYLDEPPARAQL
jgi:hypothetical protein